MRTRSRLTLHWALLGLLSISGCGTAPEAARTLDAMPAVSQSYLIQSGTQKVLTDAAHPEQMAAYRALKASGAIVQEVDYGSFRLLVVDAKDADTQRVAATLPLQSESDLIPLHGYQLNTRAPAETYNKLPAELRRPQVAKALAADVAPPAGMYIVQFVGPVKDEWLQALRGTGAQVVSYVPANGYVVYADTGSAAQLSGFIREHRFVQFVGSFEPAFRIAPKLRALKESAEIPVTVQVADVSVAEATVNALSRMGTLATDRAVTRVAGFINIPMNVAAGRITEISHLDSVFTIELRTPPRKLDEVQGQILASNLSGNIPSGPGYQAWLDGKGFSSSQFTSFAVSVADDAYTLKGHADLPNSRIAFEYNPTNQSGALGGHGFLNSHIIGGFNNKTGSPNVDAGGYHYGLGVAPYAKVGVTAIFGSGTFSPQAWEDAAYGKSARISSNSWGFSYDYVYDTNAQLYDAVVRDAQSASGLQPLLEVFAAGNDGSGQGSVISPSTAKNVISVGASEGVRPVGTDGCGVSPTDSDSVNDIVFFSSRGPVNQTSDGRFKPDIVAPGTHIEGGIPQSNYDGSTVCDKYYPAGQTLYGWSSGTSHSCPAVAGGSALVYQDFLNKGRPAPSPAMVKAYLMNSASYMSGVGANDSLPSNSQGMGRMNLGRAFDDVARLLVDQTQVLGATGQTYQLSGTIADSSKPFRVTLAWSDAPGPTTGAPWVNNLDLEVTIGGTTYKGNVFSGDNSVSGGTADTKNNIESIFLPAGTSGAFTITVKATNIAGDAIPGNDDTTDQDFVLVAYNATEGGTSIPTISTSPASLTFTGVVGGANPATQPLNIINVGSGTLVWGASSSASWLTLAPNSGTAPSTISASVDITGLAAGSYTATISVASPIANNSPYAVPVTLVLTGGGGGGQELIQNGGFERVSAPWMLSGNSYFTKNGSYPHSGKGYLYEGYVNNATAATYQEISIPAGVTSSLSFWLSIVSNERTTTDQNDKLFVEVLDTRGNLLATLATFSNLDEPPGEPAYQQQGPYSLARFAGQTVRVQFRSTTNASLVTTFRLDDVSVK